MLETLDLNEIVSRIERLPPNSATQIEAAELAWKLYAQTNKPKQNLTDFFRSAWEVIEPFTQLEWNWHFDALGEYLEAVAQGQITRLLINIPPRFAKSNFVTVTFPAWIWTFKPQTRWIFTSYSEKLALTHSVLRRALMQSDWYQSDYGYSFKFTSDQNVKSDYQNDKRGRMFSVGVGSSVGGAGGDFIVVDDPHNPQQLLTKVQRDSDVLFFERLTTRLNDKEKGAIVTVMQRVSIDDVSARCEELGYEVLKIPAVASQRKTYSSPLNGRELKTVEAGELLHPTRFSEKILEAEKNALGSLTYTAQYLQEPIPASGAMFKREWFTSEDSIVEAAPVDLIWVRYYDIALSTKKTANSTASIAMAFDERTGDIYLRDLLYGKWETPQLLEVISQLVAAEQIAGYDVTHLIEVDGVGLSIYQSLMAKALLLGTRIVAAPRVRDNKAIRAAAWQPRAEVRKIKFVRGAWITKFLSEVCAFRPDIDNPADDIVDTVSGGFDWLRRRFGGSLDKPPEMSMADLRKAAVAVETAVERAQVDKAVANVYSGNPVECIREDYPAIRAALQKFAGDSIDNNDHVRAVMALNEVKRLDSLFDFGD